MRLRHRIGERIARQGLWNAGDRVAVGVSGGMDSMVLLHVLHRTVRWHKGVLSVVTVDHGTGPHAPRHAAFVAEQASALGLACSVARLAGEGCSEHHLREARYRVFAELSVERVALAHHRDDQAETFLLAALRGAGARGLGGMRWRRDRYVRPLLDTPKHQLAEWAKSKCITWQEDPTNADDGPLRNRLRHSVLPQLEAMRPGATDCLARSAHHLAQDDAHLLALAAQVEWPPERGAAAALLSLPPAIARRVLALRLPGASAHHLDAVLHAAAKGSGVVRSPLWTARVTGEDLGIEAVGCAT
jgi:tRNA(Ile)-lysidine synthase